MVETVHVEDVTQRRITTAFNLTDSVEVCEAFGTNGAEVGCEFLLELISLIDPELDVLQTLLRGETGHVG